MSECVVRNVFLNLEQFLQKVAALDIFEALIFNYKIKSSDWLEPSALHFGSSVAEFSKQLEETLRVFYAQRLEQLQQGQPAAREALGAEGTAGAQHAQLAQTYTCELCSRKFQSVAKLSAHISRSHRHRGSSRCDICELQLSSPGELLSHNQTVHDSAQQLSGDDFPSLPFLCCRTCLSAHKTLQGFTAHTCSQAPGTAGEARGAGQQLVASTDHLRALRKYRCGLCREEYRSQARMLYHLERCRQGPYLCELCAHQFPSKKELNLHKKKAHRGAKCFFCDECSLAFKLLTSLQKHKVNRHESEQGSYPCDQCSQHFTKKIHLTNHKIRMHKMDRKFLCQVCGHKFTNSNSLNTHLKTHSEKKRFKCSYCKKLFRQKEKLKYHTRIHTGEKPHVCQTCGKSFIRKSQLHDHALRHQGKKRHSCADCNKTYAGLWDLKQHIRKKHSAPTEPVATEAGSQPCGDVEEQPAATTATTATSEACEGGKPAAALCTMQSTVLGACEVSVPKLLPVVQLGEVIQADHTTADNSKYIVYLGAMQPLASDTLQLIDLQLLSQPTYVLACASGLDLPTITY
ncbi:zinc finger protein 117-like isoform X4 [Bacillus rossius redtenbacheri]|uniref:zinc finger protein 117-like isoform X4 n=1 Tax=Bacillus rossius redtenbacheri TaxID=93214 RepID=UPI002FDD8294